MIGEGIVTKVVLDASEPEYATRQRGLMNTSATAKTGSIHLFRRQEDEGGREGYHGDDKEAHHQGSTLQGSTPSATNP